jgi:pyrroloquinoline quinone (PQQ) biosynthesis protein C
MSAPSTSRWIATFQAELRPHQNRILTSKLITELADGVLSLDRLRAGLINFYPLIENFPKLVSLSLIKVGDESGGVSDEARSWLIENIATERRHIKWWIWWAEGFGVPTSVFERQIHPPPRIEALNHYLWRTCTYGDLAERLAACNVAVEGPTGQWAKRIIKGITRYRNRPGVTISNRTLRWVKVHASYDDRHPVEALDLLSRLAASRKQQSKALRAAVTATEYYVMALEACYDLFR